MRGFPVTSHKQLWLLLILLSSLSGFVVAGPAANTTAEVHKGAEPEAHTWVVLGDSLSSGYGIAADEAWVRRLEAQLQQLDPATKLINASISGATTAMGLRRLPSLLTQYQPGHLILELGANDGLQGKPIAHIRENLATMIEMAKSSGAKVTLIGNHLPPNLGKRYTDPFFALFAQLAEEYPVTYVPFMLEGVAGIEGMMQADGLHPTRQAQERIFAHLWPYLEPELNGPEQSAVESH